ncbi:DnaD domain protein [Mycoplasma zalophidermidis]|uniref:DnaD domain protein n=1 Tax=Mycoplasma zalophidermidis TaxID=398174 RepID=A0ABS6DRQ3_9MOLU|nr:DnaD domain protein [Mycoplasma zalophidermidis]MBU4689662.1 DnaD domain protein [Mycoplasma zalophidermidis]MBU4693562.1 DnaD domain protein [Mycoplasma zalophidermidis]MCR8966479.1 DnaD domain protein [Mycoplasma zalophidermidis]
MLKNIIYPYFTVENSSIIAGEDLKNLRKFYAPILGPNAILLYEYFRDLAINETNEVGFHDYDSITYMLKIDLKALNDARIMLESVSLLSTFIDEFNRKTLFVIEKPLDRKGFKLNLILANKLLNIIGKQNFERLIGKDRNHYLSKAKYLLEVSAGYQDVFNESEDYSLINDNSIDVNTQDLDTKEINIGVQEKIDLNTFEFPNIYEAILKTDSRVFFGQIQGQIATTKIIDLIKDSRSCGFSDPCINLIFFYANEVNGKINYQYVNKIIKDLIRKEIFSFEPLENYLDALIKMKNNVVVTKKDLYKATYLSNVTKEENIMDGGL